MNQNELYHFGIKGQKWGVRRFQKKDGSLTPAGKNRYKPAKLDEALYGKKGAQRIADRRNKGDSVRKARVKEMARQVGTGLGVSALAIVGSYALSSGKASTAAKKIVNSGKRVVDSYYNYQVLDKTGKVISRYHGSISVGKNFVDGLMKISG